MPLRLAMEASKDSAIWKRVELLMDHLDDRKRNFEEWNMFETEVGFVPIYYNVCFNTITNLIP